jgi:hypothetical protein
MTGWMNNKETGRTSWNVYARDARNTIKPISSEIGVFVVHWLLSEYIYMVQAQRMCSGRSHTMARPRISETASSLYSQIGIFLIIRI